MSTGQQLRWQEPWLFSLRMRDRRGWQRKGWLIVAVFAALMLGWYLDQRYGKGLRIGLTGAVLMFTVIGVFVGFLSDLGMSEIQAADDGVARAFYGHRVGASLWRYQDILTFSMNTCNTAPAVPAAVAHPCHYVYKDFVPAETDARSGGHETFH